MINFQEYTTGGRKNDAYIIFSASTE